MLTAATVTALLTTTFSAGAHVDPGPLRPDPGAGTRPTRRLMSAAPPAPIRPPRMPPRPNLSARRAQAQAPEPEPTVRAAEPAGGTVKRVLRGSASWYGPNFAGRDTASGETYDPSELTAAHRWLPFGTRVRVTNRLNGRSVSVRINDRGPYAGHRILDVSSAAADRLRMKGSGVVPVIIEVL